MALPHWFDRFRMNLTIVEFNSDPKASTEPRSIDPNNRVLIQQMPPTATIELPSQDVFAEGFEFRQGSTVENYKWEIDGGEGMTVTACQVRFGICFVLKGRLVATSSALLGLRCTRSGLSTESMGIGFVEEATGRKPERRHRRCVSVECFGLSWKKDCHFGRYLQLRHDFDDRKECRFTFSRSYVFWKDVAQSSKSSALDGDHGWRICKAIECKTSRFDTFLSALFLHL